MIYKTLPSFPNIKIPIANSGDLENDTNLFISIGEYPVYDERVYDYMENDDITGKAYEKAVENVVENKSVLDIGCGENIDWAICAVDYYAQNAVALEGQKSTYELAKKVLEKYRYKDQVELINKYSFDYETKEKFEVCVSEIIGTIASSEGAIYAIKDAKERLLIPEAEIIPYRCQTLMGAICLQEDVPLQFHPDALDYIDQIFKFAGQPFDLRLTLTHNRPDLLKTDFAVVEDLKFEKELKINETFQFKLTVKDNCKIDGFLFWIRLQVENYGNIIDSLNQETGWENIYIPIFDEPKEFKEGDIIEGYFMRMAIENLDYRENKIHPGYKIKITSINNVGMIGGWTEFYSAYKGMYRNSKQIYKKLFMCE